MSMPIAAVVLAVGKGTRIGSGRDQITHAFPGLTTAVQEPQLATAVAAEDEVTGVNSQTELQALEQKLAEAVA